MGGKSSSSSESSTDTSQRDNRVGATDNAIVLSAGGGTINATDPGLIDFARDSISANESILLQILAGAKDTTDKFIAGSTTNADKAFEFVNTANTSEGDTTFRKTVPWLVAGASVLAIAWATRK